jgi:hypothetical protein
MSHNLKVLEHPARLAEAVPDRAVSVTVGVGSFGTLTRFELRAYSDHR